MITIATKHIHNTNNIEQAQPPPPPHTHTPTPTYKYDLTDDVNEEVQLMYTTPDKYKV